MTPEAIDQLEAELAEIFRNTPTGLTGNAFLAIPKKPASLNAMTHGLTGQHMILTAEELPFYAKMGLAYMRECRPVGVRETGNAQLMFEGRWRLHRILSVECDLFVVSPPREGDPVARRRNPDPARKVNAFRQEARNLELISRYETRILRNGARLSDELEKFQSTRARNAPDLVFDEQSNEAVDWYKRLLAISEALARAKQEYDDYQAAHPPEIPAEGETVTEAPATTSTGSSFRAMPPRATVESAPAKPAAPHPKHTFASDPFWSTGKMAA
jgi:hypothetical protein